MTAPAAPKYVGTRIYYTADVYTPDPPCPFGPPSDECECTNSYGEPTEHGCGETESSGWFDPHWQYGVSETREGIDPEYPFGTVWDFDPEDVAAAIVADALAEAPSYYWHKHRRPNYIEDYISDQIGAIDSFDGTTAYAADDVTVSYRTGERMRFAAHVYYPEED